MINRIFVVSLCLFLTVSPAVFGSGSYNIKPVRPPIKKPAPKATPAPSPAPKTSQLHPLLDSGEVRMTSYYS